MSATIAPFIGYLASVLLMIGLLVTKDLQFRIWNGLGCLFFIIYAVIIGALPVLLTNAVLLIINIYYFIKILSRSETFDTADIDAGNELALKFLRFYEKDISAYFPAFTPEQLHENVNIVVLRDLVIANMFSGKLGADGILNVTLNYTVPKYRDYKVGRFLFGTAPEILKAKGVNKIIYNQVAKKSHAIFLKKSGFSVEGGVYTKELN